MTAPKLLDLLEVECRGTPRELGRAHGETLREPIGAFIEQRLSALSAYLGERGESHRYREFVDTGRACLEFARRWDPEGTLEHDGIAEAARVETDLLYSVTNMTDVRDILVLGAAPELRAAPETEGCTSVLLPKPHTRENVIIAGQTWDLNPTDLDFVVAIHRRPTDGLETWSVTCTGALSLVGMNAEGIAFGTTNIKTRASRLGVGYLTILHRMVRARTREAALQIARSAPRAAAHTYWAADADGGSELECDPDATNERPLQEAPVVQTNHCQAQELREREGEAPSVSSQARLERAERELALGNQDVESLKALFADRSDGVESINRYPEDNQGTTTNACVVCVPRDRLFWACRGPSDRGFWKQLHFRG